MFNQHLPELEKAMMFQLTRNVVKMMIGNVAAAGGHVQATVGEMIELDRGGIACKNKLGIDWLEDMWYE